jgi:bacterioferritin-associated ferredoxin
VAVSDEDDALRRAVIDSYRVVCLCNKIRKGVIEKAIRGGAKSFEDVNVGRGPAPGRAARNAAVRSCGSCWSAKDGPSGLDTAAVSVLVGPQSGMVPVKERSR